MGNIIVCVEQRVFDVPEFCRELTHTHIHTQKPVSNWLIWVSLYGSNT